jgi:hypothetical protein
MALSSGDVAYISHHVVLPPRLPQADDANPAHEQITLDTAAISLRRLKDTSHAEHGSLLESASKTISNLIRCRDDRGNVDEAELEDLLKEFVSAPTEAFIPLEITAQNAGVIISRRADDIIFESFELLPSNEDAMKKGRLIRYFPADACKIAVSRMQTEEDIQIVIANTLATMSAEKTAAFQPLSTSATAHPGLVTELFMDHIAALGDTTKTDRIEKHTREEVLRKDSSKPWRRSPLWLLVRVSLQLFVRRNSRSPSAPDSLYKKFMILMLSRILEMVRSPPCSSPSDNKLANILPT